MKETSQDATVCFVCSIVHVEQRNQLSIRVTFWTYGSEDHFGFYHVSLFIMFFLLVTSNCFLLVVVMQLVLQQFFNLVGFFAKSAISDRILEFLCKPWNVASLHLGKRQA